MEASLEWFVPAPFINPETLLSGQGISKTTAKYVSKRIKFPKERERVGRKKGRKEDISEQQQKCN